MMQSFKADFKTYYDVHHREKTAALRQVIEASSRAVVCRLGGHPEKRTILDIGCGTGELLKVCRENGFSVFGLDISMRGLVMARDYGDMNVVLGDQESLPFREASFDYVTFISTLEYSLYQEHIGRALKEATRAMKDDARMYLEVRNGGFAPFRIRGAFLKKKKAIADKPTFRYARNTIRSSRYRDLSYRQWHVLLKENGLVLQKVWKSYKPLFPGTAVYTAKTFLVNALNWILPVALCYRVCFLCKKDTGVV